MQVTLLTIAALLTAIFIASLHWVRMETPNKPSKNILSALYLTLYAVEYILASIAIATLIAFYLLLTLIILVAAIPVIVATILYIVAAITVIMPVTIAKRWVRDKALRI